MNRFIPGTNILNTLKNRFYTSVTIPNENGCMLWIKSIDNNGYGIFADHNNTKIAPHRFSYRLHYGHIPPDMCVCHKCDNRLCVAPDHLFLATKADNCRDRTQNNRQAKGESQGHSILTENQVKEILQLLSDNVCQRHIALKFKVTAQCINLIKKRKNWKHINNKGEK